MAIQTPGRKRGTTCETGHEDSSMKTDIAILRHTFGLIFSNPWQTLVVTAPGTLTFVAAFLLFGRLVFSDAAMQSSSFFSLALLLQFVATIFASILIAVMWHRYALLQGDDRALIMRPKPSAFGRYFFATIFIVLIVLPLYLAVGFIIGSTTTALLDPFAQGRLGAGIAIGLILTLLISWILIRIGLILPAIAINARLSMIDSWKATASVSFVLIRVILIIAVLNILLNMALVQFVWAMPMTGIAVQVLLSFFQILVTLSLLSTLYGYLVEKRELA
ncbi:hypothetical protein [uncultured Roseobacter sp.]|uniref:hypothetical protein n=1 Tax=uncultured Roseobacter sp. TaxID=114847 RepID=UPI0026030736|nr:hypothetical protein [uncultured Roseobacter sp.]